MQAVQLSHDELLIVLGVLRLPMPLALGTDPLGEYTEEMLDTVLASALTSLMARDYLLELPTDQAPPKLTSELVDLVTTSALAESCLMVAASRGGEQRTVHYSQRADKAIVHTSPHERVHRLASLPDREAIVADIIAGIEPHATCRAPLSFTIDAGVLGEAVELSNAGRVDDARAALLAAEVSVEVADAFGERLGTEIARYALVAVRELRSPHPLADSVVVLRGTTENWYAEDDPESAGAVRVTAVGAAALRDRLAALVAPMARRPAAPAQPAAAHALMQ
jgi:hypothetical protein